MIKENKKHELVQDVLNATEPDKKREKIKSEHKDLIERSRKMIQQKKMATCPEEMKQEFQRYKKRIEFYDKMNQDPFEDLDEDIINKYYYK